MSAYLSPILSSGDSTPPREQIKQQQQQKMGDKRANAINPFQASRGEISANELANKLRLNKLKSQQQQQQSQQPKRQKASLTSMGNSILNDSSSDSNEDDEDEEVAGEDCALAVDQLERRAAAKAHVVSCFRSRHEQLAGESESEEERELGRAGEEERREFLTAEAEEAFCEEQRKRIRLAASCGAFVKPATSSSGAISNKTNGGGGATTATTTTASSNTARQNNQQAARSRAPQTLAEQFLQAGGRGGAGELARSASGSFSLNYDDYNNGNLKHNIGSGEAPKRQLRQLLAGFVRARGAPTRSGGGGGGERLNKKFKQILQSIPMVPTLVATTSIMTIALLLFLLLLSDTPRGATALHSHHQARPLEAASRLAGGDGDGEPEEPRAPAPPPPEGSAEEEPAAKLALAEAAALQAVEPALRRELINGLLLAPAAGQRARPQQQQQQQHGRQQASQRHSSSSGPQQQQPQQQASHARLPGRLPPQLARVRSSNKRNGRELEQAAAAFETRDALNEPQQTAAQPEDAATLFDSLGSMLFGAAGQQQQQASPEGAAEQLDVALLDGPEPAMLRALAGSSEGPGAQPGGPHRPAHLRSSALELDLSPEQTNSLQALGAGGAGGQNVRPRAASHKQPAQHDSSKQHANNHERAFDVAQIQCNNTEEGFERFACPTADFYGRYRCIEDRLFCDGYYDCPGGEDEDRVHCMYYRLFVSHVDILTNTFLTWMKNQNRQQVLAAHSTTSAGGGGVGQQRHNQQQQQQHATALDT